MKILLVTQDIEAQGGIGNYFSVLRNKFTLPVELFINGTRFNENKKWKSFIRFFDDYFRFLRLYSSFDVFHINTSMRVKSFFRDAIFLYLAKRRNNKCIVFIHGWNFKFSGLVEKYFLWFYKWLFFRADAFIVLSQNFKDILRYWGYSKKIYLLTTLVDDHLLGDFGLKDVERKISDKSINILFMARIEKLKGIYITLQTVALLEQKFANIHLLIAGDGSEFQKAVEYARLHGVENVRFLGYVRDEEKKNVLLESHIYLFPTFYGEGMPTTILEAMAFGLPVITRPMGGIVDFFQSGKMGFMTDSHDPEVFAGYIEKLIQNPKLRREMSRYNYEFVINNLVASKVLQKLEDIYKCVYNG
ncbi:glycosyltransferase family 4 protein [candidate division KSB1 bacterium]|nr:glycosyltransferase family 4 protein [candidate division KSB1 bacterium]